MNGESNNLQDLVTNTSNEPQNSEVDPLFAPLPGIAVEEVGEVLPTDHVEIVFRHARAASFHVGGFQFRDHLLRLVGPREEVLELRDKFSRLVTGLLQYDRSAITQLRTPQSLAEQVSRRVAGAVATNEVGDRQAAVAPVPTKSSLSFTRR
jgi:hypothetical protein